MRLQLVVWLFTQIASVESAGPDGEQGGELIFHKVEGGWLGVQQLGDSSFGGSWVGGGPRGASGTLKFGPGVPVFIAAVGGRIEMVANERNSVFTVEVGNQHETERPHRLVDQRGQRDLGDQPAAAREEFPQTAVQLQHYDSGGGQRGVADQALRRGDLQLLPGQEPQDLAPPSAGLGQNHPSSPSWGGRERHPREDRVDE
ncbi:hypothetical protein OIY81_3389 [Cryptosporidium canis]|nr:hypothetical protein OIY81_3389 [Cryptosporidium canis]